MNSDSSRVLNSASFAKFLDRNSRKIFIAAIVVTLLLALPPTIMDTPDQASQDPAGAVFDVQKRIDQVFESPIHGIRVIAEARDSDILTAAALSELLDNQQKLLEADINGELAVDDLESRSYLYEFYDIESNRQVVGVTSIADAADDVLQQHPLLNTSLAEATDEQVKFAIHILMSNPETAGLRDVISINATSEQRTVLGQEIGWWESPALLFNVIADNEKLGGGSLAINVGGDENALKKEEFNRKLQEILRGDEINYQLWGIAIDVNLESADEGAQAGMFITLTAIIAVAIVGLTLRSYWAVAFTGIGLAALIIWLKGISLLVGIKGGLINDMIVPIAMISFGVDFAVHAIRRYQEERVTTDSSKVALVAGMTGVMAALLLAFISDSVAFLSNTSAGIEAVIHFGLAASIAVGSAFIVLGLIVPLAVARADERAIELDISPGKNRVLKSVGAFGMASGAGVAIIIMITFSVPIGLAVLLLVTLNQVILPFYFGLWRARRRGEQADTRPANQPTRESSGFTEQLVGKVVAFKYVVLVSTVILTALAVWGALKLESTFDVKDFFDSSSDFVVSLDQIDVHVGDRGGEPAVVLVVGNLAEPTAIDSLVETFASFQANESLARGADGEIQLFTPHILGIIQGNTGSVLARERIRQLTGIEVTDTDGNGIPDTRDGIRAVLDLALTDGVYNSNDKLIFSADRVGTAYRRIDGIDHAVITVALPGTREQSKVGTAFDRLTEDLRPIEDAPFITSVGLTGSPFTRNEGLNATTSSLQKSIPIAAVAALVVLFIAMRSIRYAVVTVIPIGLVVTWLYAIMYMFGFGLNFVTATIGAVSIGVGIDYSIHMTERFREELRRSRSSAEAARRAARGTGVALAASAASSIGGFVVMGFAPMPLFSSYGILTAIMIAFALAASLLVLPALLTLVSADSGRTINDA